MDSPRAPFWTMASLNDAFSALSGPTAIQTGPVAPTFSALEGGVALQVVAVQAPGVS